MAADFFVVPSVTFRLLFVLVILARNRRRGHLAVTDHPTAAWTAQQLRNAFPENERTFPGLIASTLGKEFGAAYVCPICDRAFDLPPIIRS